MRVFSSLRSHRFSVLEQDVLPTLTLPTEYDRTSCYLDTVAKVKAAIGELQLPVSKSDGALLRYWSNFLSCNCTYWQINRTDF